MQERGVASKLDINRLRAAGYATVDSVAQAPRKRLVEIKGMGENKVDKIQVRALL